MHANAPLATLFEAEPMRWGLRGDPWLWRDMKERFAGVPCPDTGDALAAAVGTTFEQLTGRPLSHPEHFYLEKYSHGGMSSGMVSPQWWRDTGIPLLLRRHAELPAAAASPP